MISRRGARGRGGRARSPRIPPLRRFQRCFNLLGALAIALSVSQAGCSEQPSASGTGAASGDENQTGGGTDGSAATAGNGTGGSGVSQGDGAVETGATGGAGAGGVGESGIDAGADPVTDAGSSRDASIDAGSDTSTDGAADAGSDAADTPYGPPDGIECPDTGRPFRGWPLVFSFNGACFRSVDTGGLAADPVGALAANGMACAVAIGHGDVVTAADIDSVIRSRIIPLVDNNRGLVNPNKIGAIGFSAGGTLASYLGTVWARGIDPANGTDHGFRVGAVVNFYGPLRMDRTAATDGQGNLTGGGGLFYLHENRGADLEADIPSIRQFDSTNCFCASRGTDPCQCNDASSLYLDAYLTAYEANPGNRICSFHSDDTNLAKMSAAAFIEQTAPAHVAALYLCSGWKDSNVDHDANVHQAAFWWRAEHRVIVTADDGHGFPLSVCESTADGQGKARPLAWLKDKLSSTGDFPPTYP